MPFIIFNTQHHEIKVQDGGFSNPALKISKGDIVWWRWNNAQNVRKIIQVRTYIDNSIRNNSEIILESPCCLL